MKISKLIVFALVGFAAVAGFAAEPSGACGKSAAESAPVEFAGFRLGQKLDVESAAVRAEWGLGAPSRRSESTADRRLRSAFGGERAPVFS